MSEYVHKTYGTARVQFEVDGIEFTAFRGSVEEIVMLTSEKIS